MQIIIFLSLNLRCHKILVLKMCKQIKSYRIIFYSYFDGIIFYYELFKEWCDVHNFILVYNDIYKCLQV